MRGATATRLTAGMLPRICPSSAGGSDDACSLIGPGELHRRPAVLTMAAALAAYLAARRALAADPATALSPSAPPLGGRPYELI